MGWSVRNQIFFPMVALVVLTVVAVTALSAWYSARAMESQIAERMELASETLAESDFPLTDNVLRQLHGLIGAELLVTDSADKIVGSTQPNWREIADLIHDERTKPNSIRSIEGQSYYCSSYSLTATERRAQGTIHLFFPVDEYWRQVWASTWPVIGIGLAALGLAAILANSFAARISRPILNLRDQVNTIAGGVFRSMPVPENPQELSDLAESVNRMAEHLSSYEKRIRQTEQLHTLGLLGGGLAHQLRNAATGARLALDFHQQECPQGHDESLIVVHRQLALMEQYLKRLLAMTQTNQQAHQTIDLAQLVQQIIPLVEPMARHHHVELIAEGRAAEVYRISGDPGEIEQLILNLAINAIEAAQSNSNAQVRIEWFANDANGIELSVQDTGPGPSAEIAERIFEPLATDKQDGVGLGLAIVSRVAADHHATVSWNRSKGRTTFVVVFPKSIG